MQDRILLQRDGDIATLVFNRPERLNAMTIETWQLMGRHLVELGEDRGIRCLDSRWRRTRVSRRPRRRGDPRAQRDDGRRQALGVADCASGRRRCRTPRATCASVPFPVIAAVQGYAVGAGCEVVFACDLVVAAEDAKFGFPEVNIGVTITNGGTYFLPRKIGLAKARELAYTGEFIDANEAYRLGLVNRIVPAGQERAEAEKLARRIASRAPVAIQLHKTMLDRSLEASLETMLSFETEALVQTALTKDNLEGTNAFFEKREPKFTGE